MSERINLYDIQKALRWYVCEDHLKNNKEKIAYKKYMDTYRQLSNAEYKKRMYEDLCRSNRFNRSQETIDTVKEIVAFDKEIQKLEAELERMEQSKLFQKIHSRILRRNNANSKNSVITKTKQQMKWLKENFFWILIILCVLTLIIVTTLPTIMDMGDGAFFKGIILWSVAIVGGVLIFKAFARLLENTDKVWKGAIILVVMVACIIGFISLVKSL